MGRKSRFFIFMTAVSVLFIASSPGLVYAQTATPLPDSVSTACGCCCCCLPVFFALIIILITGLVSLRVIAGNKPPASSPVPPSYRPPAGPQSTGASQTVVQSTVVYKEKEIIREVVKVPCDYCGSLVDVSSQHCPSCGAPFKSR
jgi:hypothetical protein